MEIQSLCMQKIAVKSGAAWGGPGLPSRPVSSGHAVAIHQIALVLHMRKFIKCDRFAYNGLPVAMLLPPVPKRVCSVLNVTSYLKISHSNRRIPALNLRWPTGQVPKVIIPYLYPAKSGCPSFKASSPYLAHGWPLHKCTLYMGDSA